MSNRRRSRLVHDFRRRCGSHLITYLSDDLALIETDPLLHAAMVHWLAQCEVRKPVCIACQKGFADDDGGFRTWCVAVREVSADRQGHEHFRLLRRLLADPADGPDRNHCDAGTASPVAARCAGADAVINHASRCNFAFGRGHRTPQTLLVLDERDRYLIEAAQFFPSQSDREIARRLRVALLRYGHDDTRRVEGLRGRAGEGMAVAGGGAQHSGACSSRTG